MTFRSLTMRLCAGAAALALGLAPLAASAEGPAMWRLKDKDSEVYLFGTFHILPAELQWTTPAFDAAMKVTETTMTEADVTSPEAQGLMMGLVQQHGLNPAGVTLSSILGEARAAELERISTELGVPLAALEAYRPWLALVTLSVVALQKEGFDPQKGVETVVLARAGTEGDAITYLESAAEQIEILAGLDEEEMLANFDVTVEQFDDFKSFADKMLNAWSTGDVAALDKTLLADLRASSPKAFESLLVARNENWVAKIDEIMKGEGDYFIAVGAGHLVGNKSVVDLLSKKGYNVERVQ